MSRQPSIPSKEEWERRQGDKWSHRSDNMRCKTCMWFVPKPKEPETRAMMPGGALSTGIGSLIYDIGRCRRHAPTMSGFPVVFVNDFCGDHKLDENKICDPIKE